MNTREGKRRASYFVLVDKYCPGGRWEVLKSRSIKWREHGRDKKFTEDLIKELKQRDYLGRPGNK